ncbi:MAG: prepilin-type N-terminal cleavage/methylation domain-containing protein [Methylococcaceae bacterium]|nr:prepilin-type N-terminal cleavage/methylation domain-containing protein [Methylococcaceae bacterium]
MKKQSGFTLIELMISLLVGLIIVAAAITIYIATVKGSSDTIKSARLNHDLESVMSLMVNDIRRAGYWGGAGVTSDAKRNPFTNTATANIQLPSSSCILYTYDANGSGALTPTNQADDIDANEYYGFRLVGTTIRMRTSGTTTADCADGNWQEEIAGNQISITSLKFNFGPIDVNLSGNVSDPVDLQIPSRCLNVNTTTKYDLCETSPPCDMPLTANYPATLPATLSACSWTSAAQLPSGNLAVESRQINIVLSGRLTDDPTVTKTLTASVKIRNDRIFNQP